MLFNHSPWFHYIIFLQSLLRNAMNCKFHPTAPNHKVTLNRFKHGHIYGERNAHSIRPNKSPSQMTTIMNSITPLWQFETLTWLRLFLWNYSKLSKWKNFDFKYQFRVWHYPPSWKTSWPMRVQSVEDKKQSFRVVVMKERQIQNFNEEGRGLVSLIDIPVSIIRWTINLRHFTQRHADDALVPTLDHLSHPNLKSKGFLTRILRAPEFFGEVSIFSISGAMHGDLLASFGENSISRSKDSFGKAHVRVDDELLLYDVLWE